MLGLHFIEETSSTNSILRPSDTPMISHTKIIMDLLFIYLSVEMHVLRSNNKEDKAPHLTARYLSLACLRRLCLLRLSWLRLGVLRWLFQWKPEYLPLLPMEHTNILGFSTRNRNTYLHFLWRMLLLCVCFSKASDVRLGGG